MKALIQSITTLAVLHMLALIGLVGWLYADGRIDDQRVRDVIDRFSVTIEQEEKASAAEEAKVAEVTRQALEAERISAVAAGTRTMEDRVRAEKEADEIADMREHRMQREIEDLRRLLTNAENIISAKTAELDDARSQFTKELEDAQGLKSDQDFQLAVTWLESVKAKSAKQMMQNLMGEGKLDQAVSYLAAMDPRKASSVLDQFKTDEELEQATVIIEQLRQRGVDFVNAPGIAGVAG